MKSGLFKEVFIMAMDSIRMNKLRSFLTILGIVIGILTIVAMVAVIEGINASFARELESMGANVLFVGKEEPGLHDHRDDENMRMRKNLTVEDGLAIESQCPTVFAVTPQFFFFRFLPPVMAKYRGNEAENPRVIGVSHKYLQIYEEFSLDVGRFFTESENINKREVCVVGADITDALFPNTTPLNKTIQIDNHKMTVVGTLARKGKFLGQSRDNFVMIPYETFRKFYPGFDDVTLIVKVRSTQNVESAKDEITNLMRVRRKVRPSEVNNFAVFSQETFTNLFQQLTGAAFIVMIVISSIGLLVGGIGVMNIMLVTVKERTREIGLRKAIGAKNGEIRKQFLFEAVILTQTGGIIGIVLGILLSLLIRAVSGLPVSVNLTALITALLVSTGVGLFFGIYPASQAAKLNPIEALRYE